MEKTSESQSIKSFSDSMKNALYNSRLDQCCIDGCLAEVCNSGLKHCETHWNEELARREAETQKRHEKQRKKEKKLSKSAKLREEQEMAEKAYRWFRANRWCIHCGHYCTDSEGYGRLRAIQPVNPGPYDRRWETVCHDCEKAGR